MPLSLEHIQTLFATRGCARYGREPVSQLEHALQCASFAEAAGQPSALVAACLLHDFGHLVYGGENTIDGVDDFHEFVALPFLRPLFADAVIEPIRLHVEAKRYLCATEHDYWDRLSGESRRSLELQGGAFSNEEAEKFLVKPFASQAVLVRRWDDAAKIPRGQFPSLEHFIPALESCCLVAVPPMNASPAAAQAALKSHGGRGCEIPV